MDFENNGFTMGNESDAVEKFVRALISRNELSLARNIIGTLGEDYNHLLFELEVQSGNYKKALEIFNYLPKEKQQKYIHIVDTIERDAEKVSDAFKNLIKNLQSEKFPIFIAETQRLRKDYPQVVEVVALELIAAVRKGDKRKIKLLSEILEQIDRTHPALSQIRKNKNFGSIFAPTILIVLFAIVLSNLIISIFSLSTSDVVAFSELNKQISNVGRSLDELKKETERNSGEFDSINQNIESLKATLGAVNRFVADIKQWTSKASFDGIHFEEISKILTDLEKNIEYLVSYVKSLDKKIGVANVSETNQIKTIDSKSSQNVSSIKYDEDNMNRLLSDFVEIKRTIGVLSQQLDTIVTKQFNDYYSKMDELAVAIRQIDSKIEDIKLLLEKANISSKDNNIGDLVQKATEKIDTIQKEISSILIGNLSNTEKINELSVLSKNLSLVLQQLDDIKNIVKNSQNKSENLEIIVGSNEDIVDIKNKLDKLEKKVESINELINTLKIQEKESNELNTKEISRLKDSILNLEKVVDELKKSLENTNKQILELRTNLTTLTKIDSNTQENAEMSDVQKILKETKDLYELYVIGLRYYSNRFYKEAIYILGYVEDQISGLDVYFKEDTYYYQIMSYLKLGDKQNAQKKFQEYKKLFPSGNYIKELEALF